MSALAAFEAVARLGSFSAASNELALTQGAVSRQIANLEAQLRASLFQRDGRGAKLTPAGEVYFRAVAEALTAIRIASLDAMTKRHGDMFNLAIPPTFGTRWLMPRIPAFVASHPHVTLYFATRIHPFDFAADNLDASIYVGQQAWPGAEMELLMRETVVPMCSPQFLRDNPMEKPADLRGRPLLHMTSREGAWDYRFRACSEAYRPAIGMTFEQLSTVAQACIAGLGIALLPIFLMQAELASGQLIVAIDHPVLSSSGYYLVYPRGKPLFSPLAEFRSWLMSEVASFGRTSK